MRNWNHSKGMLLCSVRIVASLPMRNWNAHLHCFPFTSCTRCEPTYEELKHTRRIWILQTRIHVASLPMRNWNLFLLPNAWIPTQVASLPMRNWNTEEQAEQLLIDELRAYLWGIETHLPDIARVVGKSVASLPMRNWNIQRSDKPQYLDPLRAYLWGIET